MLMLIHKVLEYCAAKESTSVNCIRLSSWCRRSLCQVSDWGYENICKVGSAFGMSLPELMHCRNRDPGTGFVVLNC